MVIVSLIRIRWHLRRWKPSHFHIWQRIAHCLAIGGRIVWDLLHLRQRPTVVLSEILVFFIFTFVWIPKFFGLLLELHNVLLCQIVVRRATHRPDPKHLGQPLRALIVHLGHDRLGNVSPCELDHLLYQLLVWLKSETLHMIVRSLEEALACFGSRCLAVRSKQGVWESDLFVEHLYPIINLRSCLRRSSWLAIQIATKRWLLSDIVMHGLDLLHGNKVRLYVWIFHSLRIFIYFFFWRLSWRNALFYDFYVFLWVVHRPHWNVVHFLKILTDFNCFQLFLN